MPSTAPRQPKLRASCDRCGSAKLKCSREHPSCSRCAQLDVECVYGISRKSNRRPVRVESDQRSRQASSAGSTAVITNQQHAYRLPETPTASTNSDLDSLMGQSIMPDFNTADFANMYSTGAMPTLEDFSNMDIDDWNLVVAMNSDFETSPTAPVRETQDPLAQLQSSSATPSSHNTSTHDCHREACSIFGCLSFLELGNGTQNQAGIALASPTIQVPLDQVLGINRDACERLVRLLRCPCARSPHLALLYTSILSRVLIWYQQAVGCAPTTPLMPLSAGNISSAAPSTATTISSYSTNSAASTSTGYTSVGSESPMMSEASSSYKRTSSMPTLAQAVAPTQIALGTFQIDDQSVQAAMNVHLVSSEMKRVGAVIDAFATQCTSGTTSAEVGGFGGVDGLHKSLSQWLRAEHSRTAAVIRSKLSELNDSNDAFSGIPNHDRSGSMSY